MIQTIKKHTNPEPELKPEYIEKAKKIMGQKTINIKTTDNLRNNIVITYQ